MNKNTALPQIKGSSASGQPLDLKYNRGFFWVSSLQTHPAEFVLTGLHNPMSQSLKINLFLYIFTESKKDKYSEYVYTLANTTCSSSGCLEIAADPFFTCPALTGSTCCLFCCLAICVVIVSSVTSHQCLSIFYFLTLPTLLKAVLSLEQWFPAQAAS